MKCNLATRLDTAGVAGQAPARSRNSAPRPGFRNLKWLKPVYAGETVTFTRTALAHRPMASGPAGAC